MKTLWEKIRTLMPVSVIFYRCAWGWENYFHEPYENPRSIMLLPYLLFHITRRRSLQSELKKNPEAAFVTYTTGTRTWALTGRWLTFGFEIRRHGEMKIQVFERVSSSEKMSEPTTKVSA